MTRSIMHFVGRLLYLCRVWQACLWVERVLGWRHHFIVLLYHHIRSEDEAVPPLSQVEEGVTQSTLDAQLGVLKRWYRPLTSQDAETILTEQGELLADGLLVTFDDGYLDNLTLAGPILHRHRCRGLILISTGFIDSPRRFWWVRLNDLVRQIRNEHLAVAAEALGRWPSLAGILSAGSVASWKERRELRRQLGVELETWSEAEIETTLDRLEEVTGEASETCLPLLAWSQIREMSRDGFDFGAHSVTHPHMTRLPTAEVDREVADCARTLETEADVHPSSFAYPYGDYDESLQTRVEQAGMQVAYAAGPGVVRPRETSRFQIPRLQLYQSEPWKLSALILALKLAKYFPGAMRPVLSRIFGEPFAT